MITFPYIPKVSRSYYLTCPELKEYIWIGQGANGTGYMETFYSDEPETMKALIVFLNNTKGKNLVLRDEHDELPGYTEVKW